MSSSTFFDDDDDALLHALGLDAVGARLVKLEGRVFLRFAGSVDAAGMRVDYALVPEQGVLAKPSKWRKMDRDARAALLRERAAPAVAAALQEAVGLFVLGIVSRCEDDNLDPLPFL